MPAIAFYAPFIMECTEQELADAVRFVKKCRLLRELGRYGEVKVLMRDGHFVEWYVTQREHCNP